MLIALIATSAGVWFGQWQSARTGDPIENLQEKLQNTLVLPDDFRNIEPFTLVDKNSEVATEALFRDKWSMVFFGFTFCPDVCPITLSIVNESLQQLEEQFPDTDPFQVVFVTVDPKRDSAEKLKGYVEYYNKDFQAITGELNDILAFAKSQSIVVSYVANEENEDLYGIDHTASMFLVDPELRVRAKFNPPHEPDTIAADFQTLRTTL